MKALNLASAFAFAINLLLCTGTSYGQLVKMPPPIVRESLDSAFDELLPISLNIEEIADGFTWIEGPVWVEKHNMLLASDVKTNTIYKWTKERGKEVYLHPSGYTDSSPRGEELGSNGLAIDQNGALILAQHGDRRIARMTTALDKPSANYISLAEEYNQMKLNSPNDLAIAADGSIYFTDPPYGFEFGVNDPSREIPFHGVYKIKNGQVRLMTDSLSRPNGIALFPDGKRILVANSDNSTPYLYVYDLDENGDLQNGRIFINSREAFGEEGGAFDGIKIDPKGNVFAAGSGGICVFNKDGKALGRIKIPGSISNCAFDTHYKNIFITANDRIFKIELN